MKYTEEMLGQAVLPWLEQQGWEVFWEIDIYVGRIDIVARKGKKLWIIELKQSRNADALKQLKKRKGYADMISVATWKMRGGIIFLNQLNDHGFGYISVERNGMTCDEELQSTGHETRLRSKEYLNEKLTEESKTMGAPGTQGGHWTAYRQMCVDLVTYLKEHDGVDIDEVLSQMEPNYGVWQHRANCRQGLIKNGTNGTLHGIDMVIKREFRYQSKKPKQTYRFYVAEEK